MPLRCLAPCLKLQSDFLMAFRCGKVLFGLKGSRAQDFMRNIIKRSNGDPFGAVLVPNSKTKKHNLGGTLTSFLDFCVLLGVTVSFFIKILRF